MNTFIQLSSDERNLYCRQAAERMEIPLPAAVIEKDFWVCWTLNLLNEIPYLVSNKTFRMTHYLDSLHLEISRKKGGADQ